MKVLYNLYLKEGNYSQVLHKILAINGLTRKFEGSLQRIAIYESPLPVSVPLDTSGSHLLGWQCVSTCWTFEVILSARVHPPLQNPCM